MLPCRSPRNEMVRAMEPEGRQENANAALSVTHPTEQKPTPQNLIEWSQKWASDLWLCDFVTSSDINWFDSSGFGLRGKPSDDQPFEEHPDFHTRRILEDWNEELEADAERIRLVQNHSGVRREANAIVDSMLRQAGVIPEVIASFKQVLPYKMAHLHAIQHPKPKAETVSLWVLKDYGIAPEASQKRENLVSVEFNIKLHWTEVKTRLQIVSERHACETSEVGPEHWEYVYLNDGLTNKNSGSDGVLKTTSDYTNMVNTILSKTTPQTSAILFQRSSEQKTPRDYMEIEAVELYEHQRSSPVPEPDTRSDLSLLDEDGESEWECFRPPTPDFTSYESAQQNGSESGQNLSSSEAPHTPALQLPKQEMPAAGEYPRQVTVWLKGDDFEDVPFDFPDIPLGADQGKRTLWGSKQPRG